MAPTKPENTSPRAEWLNDAELQSQTLMPLDEEYQTNIESYWSPVSRLKPECIVRPKSTSQVSTIIKALAASNKEFAIRSGGHGVVAGTSNINDGVVIDLSLLNEICFDEGSETVSIGPSARWRQVYDELEKYGRMVAGAREGKVGVAGLILGGGLNWMLGRRGCGCDNVVSFEVVLADGRIITASRTSHPDLFRCLKGGGNNFGIVTNLVMSTIKGERVWGGFGFSSKEHIPAGVDILMDFTTNMPDHPDSSLITIITHEPQLQDIAYAVAVAQTQGVVDAPEFDPWAKIPKIMGTTKLRTMSEMTIEVDLPAGNYNAWFTLTVKNDKRLVLRAIELHEKLVGELKSYITDGSFTTHLVFHSQPTLIAKNSVAAGGNIMGFERNTSDGLVLQFNAVTKTAEQYNFARLRTKACTEAMKEYAVSIDGLLDWLYMNYADKSQDVLRSYGAENVRFMKDVSAKYDPQQVFQKLCPGGWKLSDVKL